MKLAPSFPKLVSVIERLDQPMSRAKAPANTTVLFQLAFKAHQQGRLEDAKIGYQQVLLVNKAHVDAWHLLGLVYGQTRDLAQAEKSIRKAIALKENSIFWSNLGHILKNTRRLEQAEAAYRRAIQLAPNNLEAHKHLSHLLHAGRRFTDAEVAYQHYLKLQPADANAHNDLGDVMNELQRPVEAERAFRRALELRPDYAQVHYNLGNLLHKDGRVNDAETAYKHALEIKPDYADAYKNLGHLLQSSKRPAEAEAAYRQALKIQPDDAEAFNDLGNALSIGSRVDESEAAYRRAVELKPDYAVAHNNLASLFVRRLTRMPQAEAGFRHALELQPDYGDARFNLSVLLLLLQRYEEAWPLHESRYAADRKITNTTPKLPFAQWQGQSLVGKSLVVWPEQGFGDYIQFVRYASLLKARGLTRLTLMCRPALRALLETLQGVDAVVTDMTELEPHDYWCLVMSLPLHVAAAADNIPVHALPYLHALPERIAQWSDRLPTTGLKVGLIWKGNPQHENDIRRSLPELATLAPLWSVPGVTFVSLQKGQGGDEASQPPPDQPLVALGVDMKDFADTAAIMNQLDLVISVDTSSAHLAGALGKPCWVLLPAIGSDWRWQLERTDTPWYPSLRLFRQTRCDDWSGVIDEVVIALKDWQHHAVSASRLM